jgi:hypothetical protein
MAGLGRLPVSNAARSLPRDQQRSPHCTAHPRPHTQPTSPPTFLSFTRTFILSFFLSLSRPPSPSRNKRPPSASRAAPRYRSRYKQIQIQIQAQIATGTHPVQHNRLRFVACHPSHSCCSALQAFCLKQLLRVAYLGQHPLPPYSTTSTLIGRRSRQLTAPRCELSPCLESC